MKNYEFKEHTADVIAVGHGDNLAEAFGALGCALFDLITDGAEINSTGEWSFDVESIDIEGLLVSFLSDLIVLHETENLVLGECEVEIIDDRHLRAVGRGEPFDPERHSDGGPVKGVSYHMLEIKVDDTTGQTSVQVLFDV